MQGIRNRLGRMLLKMARRMESGAGSLRGRANKPAACKHEWKLTHACMSHYHYACPKCGRIDYVVHRFPITGYKPGAETPLYWMPSPWSVSWEDRCKAALADSSAEISSS